MREGMKSGTIWVKAEKPILLLLLCLDVSRERIQQISETWMKGDGADIRVVVHSVPYSSLSSSSIICAFCPFGVFVVRR